MENFETKRKQLCLIEGGLCLNNSAKVCRYLHTYIHSEGSAADIFRGEGKTVFGRQPHQGCQMVRFQTENANLGKFWRVLHWKRLVYFMDTRSILQSIVIVHGNLV
jgi:hypothetical protein